MTISSNKPDEDIDIIKPPPRMVSRKPNSSIENSGLGGFSGGVRGESLILEPEKKNESSRQDENRSTRGLFLNLDSPVKNEKR